MDDNNKIIKTLKGIAKGKTVMAIYSYSMIVISFYSVISEHALDSSIAGMYGVAVGFYSYSKIQRDKTQPQ